MLITVNMPQWLLVHLFKVGRAVSNMFLYCWLTLFWQFISRAQHVTSASIGHLVFQWTVDDSQISQLSVNIRVELSHLWYKQAFGDLLQGACKIQQGVTQKKFVYRDNLPLEATTFPYVVFYWSHVGSWSTQLIWKTLWPGHRGDERPAESWGDGAR